MKKALLLISIFIISGFLVGFNVLSQEPEVNTAEEITEDVAADEDITAEDLNEAEPKILPDNPFYFAKNFWREIRTIFTFNLVEKAELRLRFANQRLIEAKKLAEETGKEEIFEKTIEKYQKEIEKLKAKVEKFKEKAEDNPKIDKFLDKFTDSTIKHQRLMTRLEKQLSDKPEVLEKIRRNRERVLEHFGEILNQLENKDKIPERLEKNLEKIEGSKYKNFKNLEVLLELENKVPEQAKEAIRQAQENALKRLHGDLEQMSPEDQEKFKDYLERISGDEVLHLRIMERLREERTSGTLQKNLEQAREQIQERTENLKENLLKLCPEKPSSATIEELKECIQEKVEEKKIPEGTVCIMLWAPVCGRDGITYSNTCFAKAAGVEIAYRGKCGERLECEVSITCESGYTPFDTGKKEAQGCPIRRCVPIQTTQCRVDADCGPIQKCGMTWECHGGKCLQVSKECPRQ